MLYSGGNHEIFRTLLLQHQPHGLHIIAGVTPISFGVQIAQVEAVLQPQLYSRQGPDYLPGNKRLSTNRRFMIEKKTTAGIKTVGVSIAGSNPVRIELRDAVG